MLGRRLLLGAALAAAAAARAEADDEVIRPVTPSVEHLETPYGHFANPGPYGLPKGAIALTPVPDLNLHVYLPPGQTLARVVVFSHDFFGRPDQYGTLLRHWASHGFAVIAPLHNDTAAVNATLSLTAKAGDTVLALAKHEVWGGRVRSCKATLDAVPKLQDETGVRLDDTRPMMAGHAYGAFTTAMMMGTWVRDSVGAMVRQSDSRVYGGLMLAPQGRGVMGLEDGSWDNVTRPLMVVTGKGDADFSGQPPENRIDPYILSPEQHKHLAWFGHITQTTYTGQDILVSAARETEFSDLLALTTAYLTAYAYYKEDVFKDLTSDYYGTATQGRVATRYR